MNGYISFNAARQTQAEILGGRVLPHLRAQVSELSARGVLQGRGPVFTGIGASHAAAAGGVWRLRDRGVDAWRLSAGDNPIPPPDGDRLVFGISQSGRSTETIASLDSPHRERRAAIVNRPQSPVGDLAAHVVDLGSVNDSYASTLGYTATAMAVALIAEAWDGGAPDSTWERLPEAIAQARSDLAARVEDSVNLFRGAQYADFVAAGSSLGTAEVGALLLREVARVASAGFGTRQYLHGSMESASDGVHVFFGAHREAAAADVLANAGHKVVFMTDSDATTAASVCDLRLPRFTPTQRPLIEAVLLQDFIEGVAGVRGVEIEEFVFHHDDTKVAASARDE
ncbi:SIS domain-containing protein [Microbacterium sp. NPDC058389]|uniref:SIS domain-containing protein n=1 Tax=Microbacterium sp. NPDC058389 TaxID=3346475 RepID=UPI0036604462